MAVFKGIPASKGIALGRAFIYSFEECVVTSSYIEDVDSELARLDKAIETSKEQLAQIKEKALVEAGKEVAEIFEAHLLILDDPAFQGEIKSMIKERKINAEVAVEEVVKKYSTLIASLSSEYMQARVADVEDVGKRLLRNLMGLQEITLDNLEEKVIVVAKDLTPSDTAKMPKDKVLAFCTSRGSTTSHTAILANSLGLPAVVGLGDAFLEHIHPGSFLIVDGERGVVIVNPSPEEYEVYLREQERLKALSLRIKEAARGEAITADGHRIEVAANIGDVESARLAIEYGAEGVGLLRTEFLYLGRTVPPSEEEQLSAYSTIARILGNRPLIIRTLDIGGDKPVPYVKLEQEANPFLGCRGIRLSFKERQIFKTQLRAILRAAATHRNIKIMFPMVADVTEIFLAEEILEEVKSELITEGVDLASDVEIGIMVETPAAAIIADILAQRVDFFSIGSNDLIQYTLACDRTNERVAYLYQPLHPAVLRLIKNTIKAAHTQGKWVGICGEMGGDPRCIPILIGLGIDELSMRITAIPTAKQIVRAIARSEAQELAEKALSLPTAEEINRLAQEWLLSKCDFLKDSGKL